jgi:hypothetical protein
MFSFRDFGSMRLAAAGAMIVAMLAGQERLAAQQPDQPAQNPQAQQAAQEAYQAYADAFLWNKLDKLPQKYRQLKQHGRALDREQIRMARQTYERASDWPPEWWEQTKSASATRMQATLWGDDIEVVYKPSRNVGFQRVRPETDIVEQNGRPVRRIVDLELMATWKPALVNDPDLAGGKLSEMRGVKRKHLAESIIWHELGHAYVAESLPVRHAVQLYTKHRLLFTHLQEFYADMTTLAHASPPAQRPTLWIRLQGLDYYNEEVPHTRAAHGIGALLLADMLRQPKKWPSVHFPPKVPEQQVELNTIIYVYEHWEKDWTLQESQRLRQITKNYMLNQGKATLQRKGVIKLSNGLSFALTIAQDREHQQKRDAWVAQRLKKLIDSGRADKLDEDETYDPPLRERPGDGTTRQVKGPHGQVKEIEEVRPQAGPRVRIPDY